MANVENYAKNPVKIPPKTFVKLCKTFHQLHQLVQNLHISLTFSHFPTNFPTTTSSLSQLNLFHYSTNPTTKATIYNIIIVKKGISSQ